MSELTGGSESGADVWYLDLLLDETGSVTPLPAGLARPLWVSVMIPEEAVTGNYTVSVSVHDAYSGVLLAHVVVIITAWDMSLAQALRNFSDTAKFGGYLSRSTHKRPRSDRPSSPIGSGCSGCLRSGALCAPHARQHVDRQSRPRFEC